MVPASGKGWESTQEPQAQLPPRTSPRPTRARRLGAARGSTATLARSAETSASRKETP